MPQFEGVVAPIVTAFDENESVYEEGNRTLIKFLASNGVKNIFCLGSWGGFALMRSDERMNVAEICISESKRCGAKIIVNVSSPSTREAIVLARHAEIKGADAVVSLMPYYYPPLGYKDDHILYYFSDLINSVKIPVHLYNNPRTTAFPLSIDLFNKLIDIGVKGMKEGGGDQAKFIQMIDIINKRQIDFDMIPSSITMFFTGLLYGVKATMIGLAVVFPELAARIYNAFKDGNIIEAARIHSLIMKIRRIQGSRGMGISACYGLLKLRGIDVGKPRKPWIDLTEEDLIYIKNQLNELGVLL